MNPNEPQQDSNNFNEPSPQFDVPKQPEAPTPSEADFSPTPEPAQTPVSPEPQPFGQPSAMSQPPITQPEPQASAFPAQPEAAAAPQANLENPGQTLGIVSIVLSFIGLSIVGIILGVISRNKSKAANASTTLGTVGMILGIVVTVIGFLFFLLIAITAYAGIQEVAKDGGNNINISTMNEGELEADATALAKQAEAYYALENDYPKSVDDFDKHPESAIPNEVLVFEMLISSTSLTYAYCDVNSAQIMHREDDGSVAITPLGSASSTKTCKDLS